MANDAIPTWTKDLLTTLDDLRAQNSKEIDLDKIEKIIEQFADAIGTYVSIEEKNELSGKINNILAQVKNLKTQTFQMGEGILKNAYIPDISVELHSVVSQTEQSVEGILDVSDAIRKISENTTSSELKEDLMVNSTKLLELCNFQDLTGQIIQRIIKRLTTIETTIGNIFHILRQDPRVIITTETVSTSTNEDKLLNGPQKEEDRPSQEQVDDLFNSV